MCIRDRVKSVFLVLGGILTPAILAAGIWAWTPDRMREELNAKYSSSSTRYLMVGGTELRIRDTGPKDAPAVLLLHGFGSSLETWEPWAQSLSMHHREMCIRDRAMRGAQLRRAEATLSADG